MTLVIAVFALGIAIGSAAGFIAASYFCEATRRTPFAPPPAPEPIIHHYQPVAAPVDDVSSVFRGCGLEQVDGKWQPIPR